jgi:hypothetical protein
MFSEANHTVSQGHPQGAQARRFRLVREVRPGVVETIDYFGPFDGWSAEWSIQMRYAPVRQQVAA